MEYKRGVSTLGTLHASARFLSPLPSSIITMSKVFTHELNTKLYSGKFSINTGLFIDGKFVEPVNKGSLECVSRLWYFCTITHIPH